MKKKYIEGIVNLFAAGLLVALIIAIVVLAVRGGYTLGMEAYKLLFGR